MPSQPTAAPAPRPPLARWLGASNDVTRTFLAAGAIPDLINLGGGLPPLETYPAAELAEIARAAIAHHPAEALGYGPIEGLPALRDALAARLSSPALRLRRENVLVTASGLQALDLLGKALIDEGAPVAVQDPTYLGALDAWRPRHPAYRPMRLDAPGFDALAALTGARFAYTVPNFSNPTGRLVDVATRRALARAARATGTWLVEDDPYGALQYEGAPLPRILTLSAEEEQDGAYDGPVAYLGTLSKAVAPGLRIGWVAGAPALVEALAAAKQGSDLCTGGLSQLVALGAIESGLVDALQPRMILLYRERRDALCAALDAHLSEWFVFERPAGGMFVWLRARDPS
ncbi:MAG TPA: PLP-dependent aminotransferase family protein, partial [Salinarimonas sp.]|nr:PLP-dependent aminotransferase family protein [Salinarimonas sp.]